MSRQQVTGIARIAAALSISIIAAACSGGAAIAPSAPSAAGAWSSNATLTTASGGECLGAALQSAVGRRDIVSTAIQQTGSSLTASATSDGNGTTCSFAGTINNGSLTLTMTSCPAGQVPNVQCGNGALRDVQIVSERISATVSSNGTGNGTDTSTWNVLMPGSGSAAGTPVGSFTLNVGFSWVFLGLPSSDFHEFTGTVAPGYQDGTMIIGPPEPFCLQCGWFATGH